MSKKKLLIGIVLAVVLVSCVLALLWAQGPAVSTIKQASQDVKGAQSPDYKTDTFENSYLRIQIPKGFKLKSSTNGVGKPLYVQQLLMAAQPSTALMYSDQLAITVGKLPVGGLKEVSDVQLRQRSDVYGPVFGGWIGAGTVVYEKSANGYEVGLFTDHSDLYATIVFSGTLDKKEQLLKELQMLYASITWK